MGQAAICMVIHMHMHQYLYVHFWHFGVVSIECLQTDSTAAKLLAE